MPIALISGPFLPDLIVVILALLNLKNNFIKILSHKIFQIFIILYLYLIIRSYFSINPLLSLESSLFIFRFAIYIFSFSILFLFNHNQINKIFLFFSIISLVLITDTLIQAIFGKNIFFINPVDSMRVTSFFGNEQKSGFFLFFLSPFVLIYLHKLKHKFSYVHIFLNLFLILNMIAIAYSGERSSLGMSLIFFILFNIYFNSYKKNILIFGSFITIFAIFLMLNPLQKERIINKTFNQILENDNIYIFSKRYHGHYTASVNIFLDNPVFGVGTKIFREICSDELYKTEFSCSSHPHNYYLQVLSETGIIGFSFLIYFLYVFYRDKFKIIFDKNINRYRNFDTKVLFFSFISIIFPLLPSGSIFNNWRLVIISTLIGFIIFLSKDIKD